MTDEKKTKLERLIRKYYDLDDLVNSIIARNNNDDDAEEIIKFLEAGEHVTMQELILMSIDLKRAHNCRIQDQ